MYNTFPMFSRAIAETLSDMANGLSTGGRNDITVYKTEKDGMVTYQFDLPGCEKEDIQADFTDTGKGLTVKAKRMVGDTEIKFSTVVAIQSTLDVNGDVKCDYRNGVLSVSIPPRKELQPRKLTIG